MKKWLAMTALLSAAAMVSACAVTVGEQQLLRPVAAGPLAAEQVAGEGYQLTPHSIIAEYGETLSGVLLRRAGADTTIIYYGGNQFTVGRLGPAVARAFAPLEVNLFLVDHRGYGQSRGTPSARTIIRDGITVYDHVAQLPGIDRRRIVVHGQSLGSFVAGEVGATRETAGVVLESSVTSTEDWVRSQASGAPVRVRISPELAGHGNSRTIGRIDEPLLLIVGERDSTTPPELSRQLFAQSPLPPERKSLAVIPGAGHNDAMLKPETIATYRAFLASVKNLSRATNI